MPRRTPPVADPEALDALAQRFYYARRFQPEHQGHRHRAQRRVVAAPAVHVGEIHADRALADAQLARAGRTIRDRAKLEDFRSAEAVDYDFARHKAPPVKSGTASSIWSAAEPASATE